MCSLKLWDVRLRQSSRKPTWGCIITLCKNPYPWMLLSFYFLLIVLPRKMRYRFVIVYFLLIVFPRKTIKTEHGHVKTKLNSTGLSYSPIMRTAQDLCQNESNLEPNIGALRHSKNKHKVLMSLQQTLNLTTLAGTLPTPDP